MKDLTDKLVRFRDDRDWSQFHNPKDLSIALSIEANELLELFLWKGSEELNDLDEQKVKDELADVFAYALLIAEHYGFDISEIVSQKIAKNAEKYPIEKAKGSATKYTDL